VLFENQAEIIPRRKARQFGYFFIGMARFAAQAFCFLELQGELVLKNRRIGCAQERCGKIGFGNVKAFTQIVQRKLLGVMVM